MAVTLRMVDGGIGTWGELVNNFLEHCESKNLSPCTIGWYKYRLQALANMVGVEPADVTTAMIRQSIAKMLEGDNKASTAKNTRTAAITFFKFLQDEGIRADNPTDKVAQVQCAKTLIQPFSIEQVQAILGVINQRKFGGQRDYAAIMLLVDTGLRLSECINIQLEHINWSNQTIKVMGKGSKERIVPFGMVCRKVLREYIARRGELNTDFLFVSDLGEHINPRHLQDVISQYGVKANITGVRVSPHTFRHTFAVEAIRAGMDILHLQRILGHSSLEMVKHYVHLVSDDIQHAHKMYGPADRIFSKIIKEPRQRIK